MASTYRLAKYFLTFALIVGFISAVSASSVQQTTGPTLALIAPPAPQSPTDPIDIQIVVTDTTNLGAFEFDLTYDSTLVTISGLTVDPFLGQGAGCDPDAARCALTLGPLETGDLTSLGAYTFGTGNGPNGSGTVAVLHLQPTGLTGTTMLHITNALLSDDEGNPTTPTTQDVTLILGDATPTPTVTPTETSTPTITPTGTLATETPTATPTPTVTPTETSTPTITPTGTLATETPTATATPTGTPMPTEYKLYLPLIRR